MGQVDQQPRDRHPQHICALLRQQVVPGGVRDRAAGAPEGHGTLLDLLLNKLTIRHVQGIEVYSLHPGAVSTDVWRDLNRFLQWFLKLVLTSEEQGASTTIMCATAPGTPSGIPNDY